MSTLKVLINKEVESYIDRFYELVDFISKYGYVVITFVLSILIIFIFSFNQNADKVVAYSSTDILDLQKLGQDYIGYINPDVFNEKVKYISANYILTSTSIKNGKVFLGEGLFTDNMGFYYPNGVVIPISYLPKNDLGLRKNLARYYILLRKVNSFSYNHIKLNNKKGISISSMKEKYNLYCMDTFLDNSVFCNANKYLLLKKIENGQDDLSSTAYDYLFNHLFLTDKEKCKILQKIFSKNYNYKNITKVVDKYCDNNQDFKSAYEIIKLTNNVFSPNIPSTYDAKMVKLVDQWNYFLHNKKIPNENIISHVNFVKSLLSEGFFTQREAFLEMNVINELKKKIVNNINSSSLINMLNLIVNGDNVAGIPGIKGLVGNIKLITSNDNIIYKSDNVQSVRERFLSLIKKQYSKIFVLSDKVKFDARHNVAILRGYLVLSAPEGENLYKYKKILVSFEVPLGSVIGNKFKVQKFTILDKGALQYLKNLSLSYPTSGYLTDIYNKLNEILSNYILNNKAVKISFCDLIGDKIKDGTCSDNTITVQDQQILGLAIKYVFDNSQIISKVILPRYVKVEIKKGWSNSPSYLKISLEKFSDKLNKLIKKHNYGVSDIPLLSSIVKKYIEKYKKSYKSKQIGMPISDLIKIDTLLKKYLGAKLIYVKHLKGNYYNLYFILNSYKFESVYDLKKNKFYVLALVIPELNKKFEFKVKLGLSDLDLEKLNSFKSDPIGFLKNIDASKIKEYNDIIEQFSK